MLSMRDQAGKPGYEELLREGVKLRREKVELRRENEQLRRESEQLRRENEHQRAENDLLGARLQELEGKMQELERMAFRQAAPFRVPQKRRKSDPRKPGRKRGHKACWRGEPDHVDQDRLVPLERCPRCGGPVHDVKPLVQFIEDIPPLRVHVTRLVTHVGRCARCGRVRSTDPLQVSRAGGCARTQIGPRALGLAAELKQHLGLTFRKAQAVLSHFGLRVSPGGLSQALGRVAKRLGPVYGEIGRAIRTSAVVNADETSWYVGRPGWWLWVFAGPSHTLYAVDDYRGAAVVQRVLGEDFAGVLVSDCLSSYDPIQCAKQKCYAHHLRALSDSIEAIGPPGAEILDTLRLQLKTAMALDKERGELSEEAFQRWRGRIREAVLRTVDGPHMAPGVEKALGRFRNHREHLFTFLDHPHVPATNNLAERMLRPAVIARKVSCGNKTDSGRQTWQTLTSIAATCRQQGRSFVELVARTMPLIAPLPQLDAA